jgi:uncharacterized protein (TIGR03083 family)
MDEPLIELGHAMSNFAELARSAEGDEQVATCPGWTTAQLIAHLTEIHRWCGAILLSGRKSEGVRLTPTEPLEEWYAGNAAALLAIRAAVDPDEPTWNFAHIDEVAAFWPRRQLHEVTIHSVDLAEALGRPEYTWDVDPDVAADGISEVIRVQFRRLTLSGRPPHVAAPIELIATDMDRSWTIIPGEGPQAPPVFSAMAIEPSGTAHGTAAELYLALWNRLPAQRLALTGAAEALFAGPRTA